MSSAPSGLDVREYAYSYFFYTVPDGNSHFVECKNNWAITKIQVFAAAAPVSFVLGSISSEATIQPNGCLTLEPNGAHRGGMSIDGLGAVLVVEFWWQANTAGVPPVSVTP